MSSPRIRDIQSDRVPVGEYGLKGWVRTHRRSKNISFIELTDGSAVKGLQLVLSPELAAYQKVADQVATGAAIEVRGKLVESPAKGQRYEFQVDDFTLVGPADPESYPLQKKGHSLEFLREQIHLRPRTNTFGAMLRVRSRASFAVHKFFQERGFIHAHTPIISTSDCEGAGEMFQVSTLNLEKLPLKDGKVDFSEDFFGEKASLTVSGQLEAEMVATALMNTYTFGPTFRSENSNTTRHLAEFWMIEPEMAFCDLRGDMAIAEAFTRYVVADVLEHCAEELQFFSEREWTEKGFIERLERVATSAFEVLEYSDAIRILEGSGEKFEFPVRWGIDLQSEHERFLTDKHVGGPVFVINYPKEIKAFYMRLSDDEKTVAAMDLLVPGAGELIGGSQREERYDVLKRRMEELGLSVETYWWYLDLRRYGTVPHAGFGLGFERLLLYVTGLTNIRDVIIAPRFPGFARF